MPKLKLIDCITRINSKIEYVVNANDNELGNVVKLVLAELLAIVLLLLSCGK